MATPFTTATEAADWATDGQLSYISGLLAERDATELPASYRVRLEVISEALEGTSEAGTYVTGHRGEMVNRHLAKPLTKRGASALIDTLTDLPRKTAAERADILEDGFYTLGGQDGTGVEVTKVYKVVTSPTSGRQYAKVLEGTSWVYAPGGVRALRLRGGQPLTLEVAQNLGQLYGVCVRCGRTLTDEGSIAAGIGPICATKF